MTTNHHEVIFAIVNSGYAEEAMAVARECGARGGTILNARGVAREEAATFFGISIHHEKEILMIVVDKNIRDQILSALYKAMDMSKSSRGIVFSLPVSDVAGLVQVEKKQESAEE